MRTRIQTNAYAIIPHVKPTNWSRIYLLAAIIGVVIGYTITLLLQPELLPPFLRIGGLTQPTTILVMGTDVDYAPGKHNMPLIHSLRGRSDTNLVVHLDPIRNRLSVLSIPRDTLVSIPGHGIQKINAANAYGGPYLAQQTVSNFLGIPIDHFMILNLEGFVQLVNELGGITVEIPSRMHYIDWTAKLNIDLTPGFHTLTGNQAMGFIRFRHTALGDIGRVQRQQIFLKAAMTRALQPSTWSHLPALFRIAQQYSETDMSEPLLLGVITFARAVPPQNQYMVMLPGNFAADNSGNWTPDTTALPTVVSKLLGSIEPLPSETNAVEQGLKVSIENDSHTPGLGQKLSEYLQLLGYTVVHVIPAQNDLSYHTNTRIVAQAANPRDVQKIKADLKGTGQIVNASTGNTDSAVIIMAGDDLFPMFKECLRSTSRHTQVHSVRPGGL
jgi:polyisoprenyl-teichoic acid--peptidoglycan teichoic acid transferase